MDTKRTASLLLTASLLASVLVACGIPEDKHNAALSDLKRCKTTLADTRTSLAGTQSDRDSLKAQLAATQGDKDALARQLGATEDELKDLRKARALAEQRNATFKQLLARLKSMIDSGKLDVKIRNGLMIVQLGNKILFDPGKTALKKDGQAALSELATVLKDIADRAFLVAGHTDNVPIRTRQFRSNWELSAARAVEVVKFLQSQGVDPKQLRAAGFSEYDPVGDNSTDLGRQLNRRIEIVLMPKIEELPSIDM